MIAPALTKLRIMAPMVRPTQLLHPQREPAPVRPAATVLLLRDTPQGIEVLMTRRSMTASFAPGAYVFPGGGVDALDAAAHAQASRRETQSDLHLTQAIAAIRESFEELGILLARREDGTMAVAWQRPRRRNSQLGSSEYGESDMFPADDTGGDERGTEQAGDGLGDSTATPPAKRGRANAKDGAEHDGALPPLVDA